MFPEDNTYSFSNLTSTLVGNLTSGGAITAGYVEELAPLKSDIYELIGKNTDGLDITDIVVVPRVTILNSASARMQSVGVSALNEVGNLQLSRTIRLAQGGLISTRTFIESSQLPIVNASMPHGALMAHVETWPIYESVILADELDLSNTVIEIDRNHVYHLYIIARKIIARNGAKITYKPFNNPMAGRQGARGAGGISHDRHNSHNNRHFAPDGQDGAEGGDGAQGPNGADAPKLSIYSLDIDRIPDLIFPGQKGGQGGKGGNGGRGGDGERGRKSRRVFYVVYWECKKGVGFGGNGGDGGKGGRGGRGAPGGDGAKVLIATTAESWQSITSSSSIVIDLSGGEGGDPGLPGSVGEGGLGGLPGKNVGYPCSDMPERAGRDGQRGFMDANNLSFGEGENGDVGNLDFAEITKEDWDSKLHAPWILSIEENSGFPGDDVVLNGVHFVNLSSIVYRRADQSLDKAKKLGNIFINDKTLRFTMPHDASYGTHLIHVETPDGDISNDLPFHVRPRIEAIKGRGNQLVSKIAPGDTITLSGRAFSKEASVYYRETWLRPDKVVNERSLKITLPSHVGEDRGGETFIKVRNEDGWMSNEVKLTISPTLNSGFLPSRNGYAFNNFSKGSPDWDSLASTFGESEVSFETFLHPVLLGAFYIFYKKYLNGDLGAAYCTGMSSTALRRYHEAAANLFNEYPASVDDPPPIADDLLRELMIAQGRLLSGELLLLYADQGANGNDQIAETFRLVEADFNDSFGVRTARTITFVPSGRIWDSGYFDRLNESHTVVPTRIVYADEHRTIKGARIYVYDCNYEGVDDRFVEIYETQNKLQFRYHNKYSSEDGYTLGTADMVQALMDDVDLPFSGPFGLTSFIVDILSSPAWLRLEDSDGNILGYKDGKIHARSGGGVVSPFVPNYILTEADRETGYGRSITGVGTGTYDYMCFNPNGRSFMLQKTPVAAETRDFLTVSNDFSTLEFTTNDESKMINLHLGERLDEEIRLASLSFEAREQETISVAVDKEVSGIEIDSPSRPTSVDIDIRRIHGTEVTHIEQNVIIAEDKNLKVDIQDWTNLIDTTTLNMISK